MRTFLCKNCGAGQFREEKGYRVCLFCESRFIIDFGDIHSEDAKGISLKSDIDMLLQKCKTDPKNAKRYANRILDIDPMNKEAQMYLRRR